MKTEFLLIALFLLFGCVGPTDIAFQSGLYNESKTASCTGFARLAYVTHSFDGSNFSITLRNETKSILSADNYSAEISGKKMASDGTEWDVNQEKEFKLTDSGLKGFVTIEFTYTGTTGITHSESGICKIK